jgi:hypothetical protein
MDERKIVAPENLNEAQLRRRLFKDQQDRDGYRVTIGYYEKRIAELDDEIAALREELRNRYGNQDHQEQ